MNSIIYVAITGMHRGGGAKIGAPRLDIGISAPDKSTTSFELALAEATKQYMEKFPKEHGIHHFGSW